MEANRDCMHMWPQQDCFGEMGLFASLLLVREENWHQPRVCANMKIPAVNYWICTDTLVIQCLFIHFGFYADETEVGEIFTPSVKRSILPCKNAQNAHNIAKIKVLIVQSVRFQNMHLTGSSLQHWSDLKNTIWFIWMSS